MSASHVVDHPSVTMSDDRGFKRGSFDSCTEVSLLCPVEATVLGYYPNLGSGIFFSIAFGMCMIAAGVLGVWKRTWTFGAAITVGLLLEMLGTPSHDQKKGDKMANKCRIHRPHPPQ